jgi:hypothetical protein
MKMFSFKIQASVFLLLVSLCSSEEHGGAPLRSGVTEADDGVLVKGGTSLRLSSAILKVPRVLNNNNNNNNNNKKKKKKKVPKAAKPPKGGKKAKSAVTPRPSSQPSCATITSQKDALLALKEGLVGNDTTKLVNWDSNTDPCDGDAWTGITCSSSDVTEINVGGSK